MNKPTIVERFADNGEHSHWELISENGLLLWSEAFPPIFLFGEIVRQNKELKKACDIAGQIMPFIGQLIPCVTEYIELTRKIFNEMLLQKDKYENYEDLQRLSDLQHKFRTLANKIKK